MSANQNYRPFFTSSDLLADSINAMDFSPHGQFLAAADVRGSLVTFDLKLGTAIHLGYLGPLSQIFCLVWSGQNELFFGSTGGIVASLIFVKEGNEASTPHIPREIATDPCLQYRATIGEVIPAAMSGCVTSLAFFQHTRPRLAIGVGRHVEIWESSGRDEWKRVAKCALPQTVDHIVSIAFLRNGDLLAAYSTGGIRIWKMDSGSSHVPGLDIDTVNSFAFSPNGLLLVSLDLTSTDSGYTTLYRLSAQPPYGLTPVQNWPGSKGTPCPSPVPVSLTNLSDTHVIAWATARNKVSVIEAAGLTEQFSPALPPESEGRTLKLPLGTQVQALASVFFNGHAIVAIGSTSGATGLRLEIWSTDAAIAYTPSSIRIKQDNLSDMLWVHIRSGCAGSTETTITLIFLVILCFVMLGAIVGFLALCVELGNCPVLERTGVTKYVPHLVTDIAQYVMTEVLDLGNSVPIDRLCSVYNFSTAYCGVEAM